MSRGVGGREIYRGGDNTRNRHPRRGEASPSRHLWVGNLPPRVTEGELLERFRQYGELESIIFVPGRSYAFVNFTRVDDAVFASRKLQGQMLAGLPLRIEFQKLDKPSVNSPHKEEFTREERTSDLRKLYHGPGKTFADIIDEKPSEILRINFPPQMNINHFDLERAFSPFGLLDKISVFPSEGYAIVRFRSVAAASFAKNALRGRLFNDPHVAISFAIRDSDFDHPSSSRFFPESFDDRVDFRASPFVDQSTHPVPLKKPKIDSFSDVELPDYPFSNHEKEMPPRFQERNIYSRSLISDFGGKDVPGYSRLDGLGSSSSNMRTNLGKFDKPINDWKWEGTIAKGGTPICRARCFPVGKSLDFMLPEFLDCTARTGLDMLSQHFYQASSSWVVFFVPETDADISFYNEFLNFLREKNRAAVAKLEDRTTLFLVPPSEFSEKVLKVPGKMSISGVILRFHIPESNGLTGVVDQSALTDPLARVTRSSYPISAGERMPEKSGADFSPAAKVKPPLMPEQLAQLASFLGQRKQLGNGPEAPVSLSSQVRQGMVPDTGKVEQLPRGGSLESQPEDQKRLQVTLQLAASILQQIQQQAKPDGS